MSINRQMIGFVALLILTSGAHGKTLLSEDFESPVVTGYAEGTTPPGWVRASSGFGAGQHGLINKDSGAFTADDPNKQGYTFRYTNSGLTSGQDTVGVLYTGVTYTVSFDVVMDISATPYAVQLIAFTYNAIRTDRVATPAGSIVLASASGNAPSDGSFANVQFQYTATSNHIAYLGYDIGIRFLGATTHCVYDNVLITNTEVGDQIPPLVQWRYPAHNATTVAEGATLTLIFHEAILAGSGNITLKKASDDSTVEVFAAGSVGITDRTATITPSTPLERETAYYVLADAGVFVDAAGNPSRAINSTEWNFATGLADLTDILIQDSFETPVVVGSAVLTAPDNWLRNTSNTSSGLANESSGVFSTPFGAQAAVVWNTSAALTLEEGVIAPLNHNADTLVEDRDYRVTFHVANASNRTGAYTVSMMAFTNGAARINGDGVVLESVSGTALLPDMGQQLIGFAYTPTSANAYLGQLVGVRIAGGGAMVDNLTFSYTAPPPAGTVIIVK